MDESDIKYILELLTDAIKDKDWDQVYEATDTMREFLDPDDTASIIKNI